MNRETLKATLGPFPPRTPLCSQTLASMDCGSYWRQKVEYATGSDDVISAFICIPKVREGRTPAIFCHHQHDWNFALGKSEVVGIAGDPDQAYAAELAERGYITFSPDAIGFEERNWSGGTVQTVCFELTSRLAKGSTLLAKILHDAMVGIDYLETRGEVDAGRIGFLGHSYGGRMAIWLPAFDRRIHASVSNCGCIPYKESLGRDTGVQMEFCLPGILHIGDIEDVVELVAPTPILISATESDPWSRGAQRIFDSAKFAFPANDVRLRVWPGRHAFTKPMRDYAYRFLDDYLK